MNPRRQPHVTAAIPYRSTACRIGTHRTCVDTSPLSPPIDIPVVYETCDCLCHSTPGRSTCAGVER
ncbi:hypothetical protein CP974_09905 [Streptomyces fradiae ATCC 10745 = DSM 40063]|nr:hypothetical protein CP974_09905 [Streptomyces fradiae ATCC 10745 = DSM 40063]